jgi:hypothetical protein
MEKNNRGLTGGISSREDGTACSWIYLIREIAILKNKEFVWQGVRTEKTKELSDQIHHGRTVPLMKFRH